MVASAAPRIRKKEQGGIAGLEAKRASIGGCGRTAPRPPSILGRHREFLVG